MIVFVSDLHLVDETAGKHNVPKRAFELFMEDLDWFVSRRKSIKTLKIVLLGDIFDLLRTERWHVDGQGKPVALDKRPWGAGGIADQAQARKDPASADGLPLFKHAQGILGEILKKNSDRLAVLRKGVAKLAKTKERKVTVQYVPGNHDRLVNFSPKMRKDIRKALGAGDSDGPFEHYAYDKDHGVYAQHGHEYDGYNYEGGSKQEERDYLAMPIGDPITTELISRIPQVVVRMAKEAVPELTASELAVLKRNFQDIENVRPFTATIEWLLFQIRENRLLKEAIEDAVDEAIHDFNEIDYVKNWKDRHDSGLNPWDEADKLQIMLGLLENFKILPLNRIMKLVGKLKDQADSQTAYIEETRRLFNIPGTALRMVIFGHTHDPLVQAMQVVSSAGLAEGRQVYLNTGTWRPRHHRCYIGSGFIEWKTMTYVTVYKPGEREGNKEPVFDVWTGNLG